MDDNAFLEALNGNQEDGKGTSSSKPALAPGSDEDKVLEAILYAGKDEDTDLTIRYL